MCLLKILNLQSLRRRFELLHKFLEERVGHRCAFESKGCFESPVKAACPLKLITQVLSHLASSNIAVSSHRGCSYVVFICDLAFNQFPKAVRIRKRVYNLTFANALDKIFEERWKVDKPVTLAKDLFTHSVDRLV